MGATSKAANMAMATGALANRELIVFATAAETLKQKTSQAMRAKSMRSPANCDA